MRWKQRFDGVTGPPVERPVTPCYFGRGKPKTVLKFRATMLRNLILAFPRTCILKRPKHDMCWKQGFEGVTGPPVERPGTPCFFLPREAKNGIKFRADLNGAFCTSQCITGGRLGQRLCLRKECPQRKLCVEFKSCPCRSFVRIRSVQCE